MVFGAAPSPYGVWAVLPLNAEARRSGWALLGHGASTGAIARRPTVETKLRHCTWGNSGS